jgi:hypothetical protein
MVNVLIDDRMTEMQHHDPAISEPLKGKKRKNNNHEVHGKEQINLHLRQS